MTDQMLPDASNIPQSPFERIKRTDENGKAYWTGREVMNVLGYANWLKMSPAFEEVYTSLCLENPNQTEMAPSYCKIEIGSGARREVKDWRFSEMALERILSRVASHKPEAVRELRRRSEARFRIETELGATLVDFCEAAGLSITFQKSIGAYKYDFCIAEKLLIEVDEAHHKLNVEQKHKDAIKDNIAATYGYKLLRIAVPFTNIAALCGITMKALTEN